MNAVVMQALEHWRYVEPLLRAPTNEAEYDALVLRLDEVLAVVKGDDTHPLASLASSMGDLIEAYDEENRPMPPASGAAALRYLMQEHGISQAGLPEIGLQPVVSEILSGRRHLNLRQVRELSARFKLPPTVFMEPLIEDAPDDADSQDEVKALFDAPRRTGDG